jgi:hypothetical protein
MTRSSPDRQAGLSGALADRYRVRYCGSAFGVAMPLSHLEKSYGDQAGKVGTVRNLVR